MSDILVVWVDGNEILRFNRDKPIPILQQAYLKKMDRQMDEGIPLGGETIRNPTEAQRAQFVAGQLIRALQKDDDATAAAMCTYLGDKFPKLKEVRSTQDGDAVFAELVFD
jgi:hypothetical protein